MTADSERRALAMFEAMLQQPEAARDAWLESEAAGDDALLSRVRAMRDADRIAALGTGAALDHAEEESPPERIGAYRIVERVGSGGMGSVYRGERETGDFSHVVAIKVIKPGLLSESLIERFQRERSILARLRHPGIAQLYDGGETEGGSPFIVMEFVEGRPLLQWVNEDSPSPAERRGVFAAMCSAVAFAHRNLIVHRDLTPSNVLVTDDADRGWGVKLIDFGIARPADVLADKLAGSGGIDSERASIVSLSLTPGYAAPERMRGTAVMTAADIYSLGRLLEKLMPPTAGDRELRAVIARATAAEPHDRYPTVEALADDVARSGDNRPVAAMAGGGRYRVAKFVKRYRTGVALAALAVLALVVALGVTLDAYARAERARRAEAARFAELRSLAGYMLFDLNGSLRRVIGNADARAGLADRAQRYLSALARSPESDPIVKLDAARGFVALASIQGVPSGPNLGMRDEARANLRQAVALLEASPLPAAKVAPTLAEALTDNAMIETHFDHDAKRGGATLAKAAATLGAVPSVERGPAWMRARSEVRRAQLDFTVIDQKLDDMARFARLLDAEVDQWPPAIRDGSAAWFDRANAAHYRGLRLNFLDKLAEALPELDAAQRMLLRIDAARPNDPVILYLIAFNAYVGYGTADGTDLVKSLRFLQTARDYSDRLLKIEPRDRLLQVFAVKVRGAEAQSLSGRGRFAEALALQRGVVAFHLGEARHRGSDSARNQLAIAHVTLGRIAIQSGDRALACDSHRAARADIAALDKTGAAMGFVATYRAGLDANLKLCDGGAAVSALKVLS